MLNKLIKAAVAALIPLIYSVIITKFPDFPISQNELVETVIWLIGIFFAGGYANAAKVELKTKNLLKP